MSKKTIYFILGRACFVISIAYIFPILYILIETDEKNFLTIFFSMMMISFIIGMIFTYYGRKHKKRIKVNESVISIFLIWIILGILGEIPFIATKNLNVIDATLETISNLTAAGVSFLPEKSEYVLKFWQAVQMWTGSFVFLSLLVTILPEVSGCFGMELSLNQGQIFSSMIGQMRTMARKILKIYIILTIISVILFKMSGLNIWDSIIMAMRCISTGGGNYFAGRGNIYSEYAAIFTMLMACGNFLLYFRLLNTILPPKSNFSLKILKKNIVTNLKIFFGNSEVEFLNFTIFFVMIFMTFTIFIENTKFDGNISFRMALFHIVSYISTTGINFIEVGKIPDYDKFLLYILAAFGGCMGSVTGGLKIIRIIILFKLAKTETLKVIHPRMITSIKVSGESVPMKIVGRVLSFFFLSLLTSFIFSVILSLSGQNFSTSVAMTTACLTNIGPLPGICETSDFLKLPGVMKILCCAILIIGRMEIFGFLMLIGLARIDKKRRSW